LFRRRRAAENRRVLAERKRLRAHARRPVVAHVRRRARGITI
jgi:hypothetical protein